MSNINFSSIDEAFPVAGQDNNTQGFRDNFNSIKIALETAKGEIADLQTYTVLKASLSDNSAVINDLQGSTVSNAIYNKFYGAVHTETVASQTDIDLNNGPFQKFTLTGNATLRFNNWAALNEYAVIRIHLKSDGNGTRTPTLTTVNAGTMVIENGVTNIQAFITNSSSGIGTNVLSFTNSSIPTSGNIIPHVGGYVSGTNIPADSKVVSSTSNSITIDKNLTATVAANTWISISPIAVTANLVNCTLNTNGKHKVIEAWSHDHGTNVYIRYLGEY